MSGNNKRIDRTLKTDSSPISSTGAPQNPKRAAAISYDPAEHEAPVLSAFGEGHVAEKIIAVAKESGVPVLPDPSLTALLSKISVGDEIPEELYEAVAKVLIFVSEVDKSYGDRLRATGALG